jgi:uncharacterized protein
MKFKKYWYVLLFTIVIVSLSAVYFPKPKGWVNDYAGKLSISTKRDLLKWITELKEKTGFEIAVAVITDIGNENYNDYATELYNKWLIGSNDDMGVLIMIAVNQRKLKIEVGYGAESIITDSYAGRVKNDYLIPNLKNDDYNTAIKMTVAAISSRVAKYFNVSLTGIPKFSKVKRTASRRRKKSSSVFSLIFFIFLMIVTRGRILPWLIIFGGSGRSYRSSGSFGGFGGSSGSGIDGFGGFGGFGGGSSGGGGAGGSF